MPQRSVLPPSVVLTAVLLALLPVIAAAQPRLDVTIQAATDIGRISPLIYGTNVLHNFPVEAVDNTYPGVPARRFGGDRVTGFNWENNYSNGGIYVCTDPGDINTCNPNDGALPYFHRIPAGREREPGAVLRAFHDVSRREGSYSLVQLPMAGYVARDGNGAVPESQKAPSQRWDRVAFRQAVPTPLPPDPADGVVYVDQQIRFLREVYGGADVPDGVRGYELDNEPDLWHAEGGRTGTHPRIVPDRLRVADFMQRTVELSRTIRDTDPAAEVYGPAIANYHGLMTLHDAPDWQQLRGAHTRFVDYYLAAMRDASLQDGRRLLDVFTLHWYSQADGVDSDDTSPAVVRRRLDAPRSLWDPSYVEQSWITQYVTLGAPIRQLRDLKESIDARYPGTGIGLTEWRFGAKRHISGGLAIVDALGIFGREGVAFATYFDIVTDFSRAAFDLYRNADGRGMQYGTRAVVAAAGSDADGSAYAAWSDDRSRLHVIVINKRDSEVDARIQISGAPLLQRRVPGYGLSGTTAAVVPVADGMLDETGVMTVRLPAMSAVHYVCSIVPVSAPGAPASPATPGILSVTPHPLRQGMGARVEYRLPAAGAVTLLVRDLLGRECARIDAAVQSAGTHTVDLAHPLRPGWYMLSVHGGEGTAARGLLVR